MGFVPALCARFAGRLSSEPEQGAPACCRLCSPCFPAHLEQRQMLEFCPHSHASAPALAPTSPQGPTAFFLLPDASR